MQLGVIVVNYKREDLTINLVQKELSKIEAPHIIIIVNNSANKNSNTTLCNSLNAELVTNVSTLSSVEKKVYIIPASENLGFAKGNNLGAEFCRLHFNPDYLLFTNNDIQLKSKNVVEQLILKLQNLPDVGVIGPKVVGLDGKQQSPYPYRSCWDKHIWMYWSTLFYSAKKKREKFRLDYPQYAKEGFHYYVMGSFFIVRAIDFYNCGMFDPKTFLYAEELILSERMASINRKVYYYPNVTIIHAHGATTKKYSKDNINDWLFESECYYYRKYRNTNILILYIGRITHALMKMVYKLTNKS